MKRSQRSAGGFSPRVLFAFAASALVLAASGCGGASDDATPKTKACAHPSAPVFIEGGRFRMGRDDAYPEEGPARDVDVSSFWIDPTEVTVERFTAFVAETGYVTVAEKPADPASLGNLEVTDETVLEPGGAVFDPTAETVASGLAWWTYAPGATWRFPRGPDRPAAAPEEPATQIAFEDARAFAAWAGGRLPTEAEWEYAARAGGDAAATGFSPPDEANTWQGFFPVQNTKEDGFEGVAPAGCFAPNAYGLYDMIGNVWEWTADPYAPRRAGDAAGPGVPARVIKGGSYLCAENYCMRYRPAARHAQETGLGTNHIGFRVAYDRAPQD